MVAPRPRRSNAAQSFKIQFPDISGSEAEVSGSGDDENDDRQDAAEGDEAGVNVKKDKGKGRAVDDKDDAEAGDEAGGEAVIVADDNSGDDDIESQSGSEYAPDQDKGNKLFMDRLMRAKQTLIKDPILSKSMVLRLGHPPCKDSSMLRPSRRHSSLALRPDHN